MVNVIHNGLSRFNYIPSVFMLLKSYFSTFQRGQLSLPWPECLAKYCSIGLLLGQALYSKALFSYASSSQCQQHWTSQSNELDNTTTAAVLTSFDQMASDVKSPETAAMAIGVCRILVVFQRAAVEVAIASSSLWLITLLLNTAEVNSTFRFLSLFRLLLLLRRRPPCDASVYMRRVVTAI